MWYLEPVYRNCRLIRKMSQLLSLERWRYLFRCSRAAFRYDRRLCPNCGCRRYHVLQRKYVITALARCAKCRILYRIPTDPVGFNRIFYEKRYSSGLTTDFPDEGALRAMKASRFRGTPKDFSRHIALLRHLGVGGCSLLDFGASWGYGTFQFAEAGFDVMGFELSRPRARYAREMLGVPVVDSLEAIDREFDVVFSNHVLEHVPRPSETVRWMLQVLKPDGLMIAITPNGCVERCREDPVSYKRTWGLVHPYFIDREFYSALLCGRPTLLTGSPFDLGAIRQWDKASELCLNVSGWELLCVTTGRDTTSAGQRTDDGPDAAANNGYP